MTETDIEIVKTEYEHQEMLCSEIASNKSFVGTMASIAAFIVMEWLRTDPHKAFVIPAVASMLLAAILFLIVSWGQDYKFPGGPQEWIDKRVAYARELEAANQPDDSDQVFKEMFYRRLMATTEINRNLTESKQRRVEWAGRLSAASILLVVIHSVGRYVFF